MKHARQFLLAAALAGGLSSPALAQQAAPTDHGAHHPPAAAAATDPAGMAEGEVRRVDRPAGKITLRHGEIKSLDMPPMTMVFAVRDPALLEPWKVGDKVLFRAESQDGKFTVIEIRGAN